MESILLIFLAILATPAASAPSCFEAIFNFGDSLSDTGNKALNQSTVEDVLSRFPPYGETYFGVPTGRYCDGRVQVDLLAQALGLPFMNPILASTANFTYGANIAYAGATSLNVSTLASLGINSTNPAALTVQIERFRDFKKNKCGTSQECVDNYFGKSLFVLSSIGGNDAMYGRRCGGLTTDEVLVYVPLVVNQIRQCVEDLINEGAKYLVIEGGMPLGCVPYNILLLAREATDVTDEFGCLTSLNRVTQLQNSLLQDMVFELSQTYSKNVSMVYVDYYSAYVDVLENAETEGFIDLVNPCYDKYAQHNYLCSNPDTYVNWDHFHPSEAFNKAILKRFLFEGFAIPPQNFLTQDCNLFKDDVTLEVLSTEMAS